MKIFGIGLARTGTLSLTEALNIVGYRAIHLPSDEQTIHQLMRGDYKLSLMDNYDAATDTTVVGVYAQLDKAFPNSKFILTLRDKKPWLESCKVHWTRNGRTPGNEDLYSPDYIKFIDTIVYGCYTFSEERFSYVYDVHLRNVREYFSSRGNLLEFNICEGEGWGKLCPFLNKPVPSVSFPWENKQHCKIPML